jgi:predicted acetyltransferase
MDNCKLSSTISDFSLIELDAAQLPAVVAALERGLHPDNIRGEGSAREMIDHIARDPAGFLAAQNDPEAKAGDITLPDGTITQRLPGLHRWMWDGEISGVIGFRWTAAGVSDLPPQVLGHIGYAVAPWKRGRGYATRALALILPIAREKGLPWVDLTTDEGNLASQKSILRNGGRLVGRFEKAAAYGGGRALKYRIDLDSGPL